MGGLFLLPGIAVATISPKQQRFRRRLFSLSLGSRISLSELLRPTDGSDQRSPRQCLPSLGQDLPGDAEASTSPHGARAMERGSRHLSSRRNEWAPCVGSPSLSSSDSTDIIGRGDYIGTQRRLAHRGAVFPTAHTARNAREASSCPRCESGSSDPFHLARWPTTGPLALSREVSRLSPSLLPPSSSPLSFS